ncbi:hypothetical protein O181_007738 [Austropuccinia psidii MF-1]|uniref:Uncharacterized protein n=1 Tax=Austropuccinia psidii MF-1 TaxID=1389203 RepID=A0A9Q3GHV9_9BASI|nr:hypothetical protein [Austropuccinia psidii MF-1]
MLRGDYGGWSYCWNQGRPSGGRTWWSRRKRSWIIGKLWEYWELSDFGISWQEDEKGGESAIFLICFTTPSVLILEIETSEQEYIGLPPTRMGPSTLVHLATSLCLEPVTISRYQYPIQSINSPYSQLEYPEIPSGIGASEAGRSFSKGPSFLLQNYLLMLEAGGPVQQHCFIPTKQK